MGVDPSGEIVFTVGGQGSSGMGHGAAASAGRWFNVTWDQGLKIEYGNFVAGETGSHIGASAGAGGGASIYFTNDWKVLKGPYAAHGGSGGTLGKAGVDFLASFNGVHPKFVAEFIFFVPF